jgi:histidine triad (HIT) family protein
MDCTICTKVAEAAGKELYADKSWVGMRAAGDKPGWVMLAARRHVEGTWGLNGEEAASFGIAVNRISEAIRKTTDSSRVYLVGLGEGALHCHFLVIPRVEGLGEDIRAALRKWGDHVADVEAADASSAKLRKELVP